MFVTGKNDGPNKAIAIIESMTHEYKIGERAEGEVVKIMDFGAFVEILPGTDGMVHISKFVPSRIQSVSEVVKEGDVIPVKVMSVDDLGRINLSAIDAGFKPKPKNERN